MARGELGEGTAVIDGDQLRWLLEMCRTGEGLEDEPRPEPRPTSRPSATEMRHAIASSLPPLRLDDDEIGAAVSELEDAWDSAAPPATSRQG